MIVLSSADLRASEFRNGSCGFLFQETYENDHEPNKFCKLCLPFESNNILYTDFECLYEQKKNKKRHNYMSKMRRIQSDF